MVQDIKASTFRAHVTLLTIILFIENYDEH